MYVCAAAFTVPRSNSMSYFYICPTERVLDTAKSPNPGAVCPDRAQRAAWERQGCSIITDGSQRSTTTHTHKYMQGELGLNTSHEGRETRRGQSWQLEHLIFIPTVWSTTACRGLKTENHPLATVDLFRDSTWCCVEEEKKGIFSQKAWWDYKQMWPRRHKIQSRLENCIACFWSLWYFMRASACNMK